MSKKLVHHLFGQHSLRYVPRSEVDMSPAQIFTYGGQHPPVSRILVFVSQRAFLSTRDLQSLRTGSETADAFQADGNVKASEFLDIVGDLQTCSCRSEKKRDTVVFAVSSCRSLVKTSKQQVFVDTGGESNNMLNLGDIRRPTSKLRCAACGASAASTARCSEQIIKDVNSSDGELRINGRMVLPKNTQEKNFTHDTKVG